MKAHLLIMTAVTCLGLLHVNSVLAQNNTAETTQAAGPGSGNGGNVAQAENQTKFLDLVRKASKVPYTPKTKIAYQTLIFTLDKNPGYASATILQPLVGYSKSAKLRVLEALNRLKFILVNEELPALDDTGIISFTQEFKGVTKRLALQNRRTGQVLVNVDLLEELLKNDPQQVGVAAFFLHEALIRVFYDGDHHAILKSTEMIGSIVNVTFGKNRIVERLEAEDLAEMLTNMGIPATPQTLENLKHLTVNSSNITKPDQFAQFYVHFAKTSVTKSCVGDYKSRDPIKGFLGSVTGGHFVLDLSCNSFDNAQLVSGNLMYSVKTSLGLQLGTVLSVNIKDSNGAHYLGVQMSYEYGDRNDVAIWMYEQPK